MFMIAAALLRMPESWPKGTMKESDRARGPVLEHREGGGTDAVLKSAWEQVDEDKRGNPVNFGELLTQIERASRSLTSRNGEPELPGPIVEEELLVLLRPIASQMRKETRLELAVRMFQDGLLSFEKAALLGETDPGTFQSCANEKERRDHEELNDAFDSLAASLESSGVTEYDLQSALPEARARVAARRYPELAAEIDRQRGAHDN